MAMLKKLRAWWREFWGCGLDWTTETDSHCWANKVEILRRLSSGSY